jgi:hypothetical protein
MNLIYQKENYVLRSPTRNTFQYGSPLSTSTAHPIENQKKNKKIKRKRNKTRTGIKSLIKDLMIQWNALTVGFSFQAHRNDRTIHVSPSNGSETEDTT